MQSKRSLQLFKKGFKRVLIAPFLLLIYIYRNCISPFTPNSCRFNPTCSQYAIDALKIHGLFKGSYLTIKRILRCHPWGGFGDDPVPAKEKSEGKRIKK